jgi:hypothetical protein
LDNFGTIDSLARFALGAKAKTKLTLSQQSDAIWALSSENTSKTRWFAARRKMLRLQLLDSVVQNVMNASEVTFMALTANQLARRLNCAWVTVKRAIRRGELKAVWDEARREWLIEEGRELAFFRAKLEYLKEVRRFRSSLMKTLWQTGRLKPRKKQVQATVVVERLKRPSLLLVGQGIGTRTMPIVWRDKEGETACPSCGTALKVR